MGSSLLHACPNHLGQVSLKLKPLLVKVMTILRGLAQGSLQG